MMDAYDDEDAHHTVGESDGVKRYILQYSSKHTGILINIPTSPQITTTYNPLCDRE